MSKTEDRSPKINVRGFEKHLHDMLELNKKMIEKDEKTLPLNYFDFSQTKMDCSVDDIVFSKPEDMVENHIRKEVMKTRPRDHEFVGRPNKLTNHFSFKKPPNFNEFKSGTSNLYSYTTNGRVDNKSMFPYEETNYLSDLFRHYEKEGSVLSPDDAILSVAVYHPIQNHKTEEFLVLGSQKLTELRDKIYCLCEHIVKSSFQSSYFFIENTFYNDTRTSDKVLCEETIKFANETKTRQTKKPYFTNLQKENMQNTSFNQLNIKIGKRYLYCHKGSCKHYIVFTQVRGVNRMDNVYKVNYPKKIFQCRIRRRRCHVCEIFPARSVTFKQKHSPFNPTFWCSDCFDKFFYDNEKKLAFKKDYQVYRYFHD